MSKADLNGWKARQYEKLKARIVELEAENQLELLVSKICHCRKCLEDRNDQITPMTRMIVCPICGNKRCPTANDHRNACTNSNEHGQPGSAY